MGDRVRVVGEQRQFRLARPVQALAVLDQPALGDHAQAHGNGVVEVAPRQVDLGAVRAQALEQGLDLRFELQFRKRARRVGDEHRGDQRHRGHRHDGADGLHQVLAQRRDCLAPRLAAQFLKIDAARQGVFAQRDRRAEIHAGVAEAVPFALHQQAQVAPGEAQRVPGGAQFAGPACHGVGRQEQRAVFQHAVVVQTQRYEKDVALAVEPEGAQHVVDHAQARRAHQPVARQPAFGKHRLRHTRLRGHGDVALKHAAIEFVLGIAPHEVRPHGADQRREWPDARPFAHRVGKRGLVRGQIAGQHVIHVGAVVHDEHHGGVLRHAAQALGVDVADAHAVQALRDLAPDPVADAEVQVSVEGRHDLARVALDGGEHGDDRHAVRLGELVDGLLHLRVAEQAVNENLAASALERPDADAQARAQFVDDAVGAPGDEPADRRHQQAVVGGPGGQRPAREGEPQWNCYRRRHVHPPQRQGRRPAGIGQARCEGAGGCVQPCTCRSR